MQKRILSFFILVAAFAYGPAVAQTLPDGPVTMIVPFPAGGGTDTFARALADDLRISLNKTIVVTNVGGGGGAIGMARLASAKADGLTIGIGSTAGVVNVPVLKPATPYDPLNDFTPIGQFTAISHIFAVNKEKMPGVDSIAKLIEFLKKNPGKVNFGSPGVGTGQHLAAELFQQMSGTKMVHVPYSGSNQVVPDLLGGQIDMAIDTSVVMLPQIKTGKLNLLAWTGRTRPDFDSQMPTVAETIPGYDRVGWHGLFLPAKAPQTIVDIYSRALQSFAAKPETITLLRGLGVYTPATTPAQYREDIKTELERVRGIIKNSTSKFD